MEFREVLLNDCIEKVIDHRGKTPKKLGGDWLDDGIPVISAKNVKNGFLKEKDTIRYISEEMYNKWMKEPLLCGDILLASEGATLGESMMWRLNTKAALGQRLFGIRTDNNILDNRYFSYYINSREFQHEILARSTGTSVLGIKQSELRKTSLLIPDIETQRFIGDLVDNIQKKLIINNEILNNLEELSQTIFKRWFIDFEFPNENGTPYKSGGGSLIKNEHGSMPISWSTYSLGDFIKLQKGLSYKGEYLDRNHERKDSIPLLSLSNFNFYKGFKNLKTKYYFGEFKERHLVHHGDLIIAATDLTQDRKILGSPAIVPRLHPKMIYSLDVFRITKSTLPINFLYFLLQTQNYRSEVEGSATGTTVVRISQKLLESVKLNLPGNHNLIDKFNRIITPYMEKIEFLTEESKQLSELLNTLPPKLMSGEIELPENLEVQKHAELLQRR